MGNLQGVDVRKQCGHRNARIVTKWMVLWILEADMLNAWPSVSGQVLPDFFDGAREAFDSKHDLVSSGAKCEPTVVAAFLDDGDQK